MIDGGIGIGAALDEDARKHRQVVRAWAVSVALLVPLVVFFLLAANNAVEHKSNYDWEANHRTKQELSTIALVLFGAPTAGTVSGTVVAAWMQRNSALGAARGAMWSAIGLWVALVVQLVVDLRNWEAV
ncbi:hypothetical protein [Yinghuangia soli]|uniref:Uncharacterized protein n=1 Tax=Yinghuangia soli TaxID=2908204 RepID=A0AA41U5N8_9ACTN|nr:hypothetical protein [Yinghuangia soli]MCF2532127.1 hypothetical protein [Yinghuangia soli]